MGPKHKFFIIDVWEMRTVYVSHVDIQGTKSALRVGNYDVCTILVYHCMRQIVIHYEGLNLRLHVLVPGACEKWRSAWYTLFAHASIIMLTATSKWYFFGYSLVLWWWFYHMNLWFLCTFRHSMHDLQYLIQILTWLAVLMNYPEVLFKAPID